jgi:hypothetical protein
MLNCNIYSPALFMADNKYKNETQAHSSRIYPRIGSEYKKYLRKYYSMKDHSEMISFSVIERIWVMRLEA